MPEFYTRTDCRMCGSARIECVLPLTPSAVCDAYTREKKPQKAYPLDLFLCRDCGYVHVPHVVDPETIYRDYIYVTTSSMGLAKHFAGYADSVLGRTGLPRGSLVVDLGSNDGTLLKVFRERGMEVLGVEPARRIAAEAEAAGVPTLPEFFDAALADRIRAEHGPARLVTINNLYANIDDLRGFTEGVRRLLASDGVFVIESSYLGDLLENMVFDFIYHEHLTNFSIKPLERFLGGFGLELIDLERVPTKGGSLRYYFQPRGGPRAATAAVAERRREEQALALDDPRTYAEFARRIDARKRELLAELEALKAAGKSIAAFGASATSTTLIYHFGLQRYLEYIVDDNPAKQATYSPGLHIPVLAPAALYERRPDAVVLLAWRYAEPILRSHRRYLDQGGRFLIPLPEVRAVAAERV